jgi:putative heme transporter
VASSAGVPRRRARHWRVALIVVAAAASFSLLVVVAGSALADSAATLTDIDWLWLGLALMAQASSMAAFARTQRRLLRAGGTPVHLSSVMAVTYAGNAISVSLPLAGPEISTAFSFRQFITRQGIDPAVAAWALAVSGIVSSFAFGVVLAGGAVVSGSTTAAVLGLFAALVSLLPTICVLAALRYQAVRGALNRLLARLISISRRFFHGPSADTENALEQFLDRIAAIRLPRVQYAEVFGLALWNWVADCLCLACSIRATGSYIPWQGLFLAYGATMTAGSVGLTPGGLGIIEAVLSGALVAAGLQGRHAIAAVLVYRLVSFWVVIAAGWVVMAVLFRQTQPVAEPALPAKS